MSHVYWDSGNSGNYNNSTLPDYQLYCGTHQLIREELIRANKRKHERIMDLLSPEAMSKLKGMDLREKLMFLLEVILNDLDDQIQKKIKELQKLSKDMKRVTKRQHESRPGKLQGMNLDSSVKLQQLTMLVQRRQRLLESITNALKSLHDADMNSVRRIV